MHPRGFPGVSGDKESAYNAGNLGSTPWSGRSAGEGNGYQHQYSCLENSTDRGSWRATVHGIAKSWTRLTNTTTLLQVFAIGRCVISCFCACLFDQLC